MLRIGLSAAEYNIHRITIHLPESQTGKEFTRDGVSSFYKGHEMLEMIQRAALALGLTNYTAEAERRGKDIYLTSIRPDEPGEVPEEKTVPKNSVTFGADAEYMIFGTGTERPKAVQINSGRAEADTDDALIRKGYNFYKPVFELRPSPASSGEELHSNLLSLYSKAVRQAGLISAEIRGGANPFGRFMLGGHFHFGSLQPSFRKTKELDAFLAIPWALTENRQEAGRRKSTWGCLGNVRSNRFGGFEYRTLSSWAGKIPGARPLFTYMAWLVKQGNLPSPEIPDRILAAFAEDDREELLQYTEEVFIKLLQTFRGEGDRAAITGFKNYIKRNMSGF
ncbi:putative amidoligase domain-containing protein [Alteribacter natronophilus]|uniref:putative amidoligase domain-containing protein n=1 Tax=Alteribacter natronophilus TaxID=2583810 RepID=UPI00110F0E10|nr:hypothetical protein [Alteribacter natronophilus]TMW73289.1 hypothetical protein FGB90_02960 [Alteribacter natronophilus]